MFHMDFVYMLSTGPGRCETGWDDVREEQLRAVSTGASFYHAINEMCSLVLQTTSTPTKHTSFHLTGRFFALLNTLNDA